MKTEFYDHTNITKNDVKCKRPAAQSLRDI